MRLTTRFLLAAAIGPLSLAIPGAQAARGAATAPPAHPNAAAAADFDENGTVDRVALSRDGLALVVDLGDGPAARAGLPGPADFLGAGDFDNDGHADLLVGARDGSVLRLLRGDGHGDFADPITIALPGPLVAMATGEIDRPDGLADFAVAVRLGSGSRILVYEDPRGAWRAQPETFDLAGRAADLVVADLDGDFQPEVIAAAGDEIVVVRGRDRRLSLGTEARAAAAPARLERLPIGSAATSIAAGRFLDGRQNRLAVLSADGRVRVAPASLRGPLEDLALSPAGGRLATEAEAGGRDRLLWVDPSGDSMTLAGADLLGPATTLTTFTVTNTADAGAGSLRAAIAAANATPGADTIVFNIPGPAPWVISPASPLPAITEAVTLDGTTQPGYAGAPVIQLDGALAGAGASGLVILSGAGVVRGLVIRDFDGHGIRLASGSGNVIERCYIGTDVTGALAHPNHQDGIRIEDSPLNTIGGTAAGAGNVLSANLASGVEIDGGPGAIGSFSSTDVPKPILDFTTIASMVNVPLAGAVTGVKVTVTIRHTFDGDLRLALIGPDGTRVDLSLNNGGSGDNYQGTVFDDAGTVPITSGSAPFASPPSYIPQSPLSAFTGRPSAGPWMLEVSDTAAGDTGELLAWSIDIATAATFGNQILGNRIGTDAAGSSALGNQVDGVRLVNTPANNVGSPAPGARNIISGNGVAGIETTLPGSAKNLIQGNYIGTDAAGGAALPQTDGVYLRSDNNLVGGTAAGAGNVVSGNGSTTFEAGVHITGTGNLVQGNKLGTNAAGTASVPNGFAGVEAEGPFNTIGGAVAGAGNLISGNTYLGIALGPGGGNNTVQGNLIGTNPTGTAALPNGTTGINVLDSGSNQIGGSTPAERNIISGNLTGGVSLTKINSLVGGNHVEGNYIGTDITGMAAMGNSLYGVSITTALNVIGGAAGTGRGNVISGNGSYGVTVYSNGQSNHILGNIIGLDVAGAAALPNGGAGVELSGYADIVGGTGPGEGNLISGNAGPGVLAYNIPGFPLTTTTYSSTDVPKAIPDLSTITSTLSVSDTSIIADVDVTIDITHTFDSDLIVSLVGPGGTNVALSKRRGGSGDNFSGTIFDDEGALPIASGSPPFSSPPSYVPDEPLAAFDGLPAAGVWQLVISDTAGGDVGTLNAWSITVTTAYYGSSANQILGNRIGTDASGSLARGNLGAGVRIENAAGNLVGDASAGSGNVIAANQRGIELTGSGSVGNMVQGNFIGTQADGLSPLGNLSDGVFVDDGAFANRIGRFAGNTIAFNVGSGVRVASGRSNAIVINSIHSNGALGIDLDPPGVTANDPGDADAGPNDLQNYPGITATPMSGNTLVAITFNSRPNENFVFHFYDNTAPDPSGHGEGQTFFGGLSGAVTDAAGNFTAAVLMPGLHNFVTATATDQAGNTSEFSEVGRTVLEASPAKDMTVERSGALLKVTYTPACGATDHVIYWGMAGPAPIGPPGLSWINAACGMGVSGTAFFDPGAPEPGRLFYFIIAGQNGSVEGSYGQASNGVEEPEATLPVVCDLPQYLGGICH